jgi:hypothetical protein
VTGEEADVSRSSRLLPAVVVATVLLGTTAAEEPGFPWRALEPGDALEAAAVEGKLVLIDVRAEWCAPCSRQEEEVWGTADGARLAEDTVPIRVDFDAEEGQAFKRERNVLGLPSVLVLRADGSEVDRVVGYEEREAFLAEIRTLLRGADPLPDLRRALDRDPDDPERMIAVARRQVQRGETRAGLELLHRVQSEHGGSPQAAEALFIEGRFLHRVKEDPAAALPVWLRLVRGYRESELRPGGISWTLRAYAETGRVEEGWTWIRRTAAKDGHDGWAAIYTAQFAVEHDRRRDVAQALLSRARADAVAAASEEVVAELEAALARPAGDGS